MKTTFKNISPGETFKLTTDLGVAEFVRVQWRDKSNVVCLSSNNASFLSGEFYFLQPEEEVFRTC